MLTADRRTLFLIRELLESPAETPWLEFKENNRDAAMIGRLISALSNASLRERLGIAPQNAAQASSVIKAAMRDKQICLADPQHPKTGYFPYWAQAEKI